MTQDKQIQAGPDTGSTNQAVVGATPDGVVDPIAALDQEFVLPSTSSSADGNLQQEQKILQRQSFRVGELRLLISQDAGREVTSPPAVSRIPNTASWMKGIANVRGGLVPVVDLAEVIGVERDTSAEQYLMISGHGEEAIGMLIDGLPRGRSMRTEERLGTLPPIPDAVQGCVTAAYDQDDLVWLELNTKKFFEALGNRVST